MSIALLRFILMLSFANPMAVVLSHNMVVGGCGYPKSARIVRRPAACWPPVKSAAYSASPADATKTIQKAWMHNLVVVHYTLCTVL